MCKWNQQCMVLWMAGIFFNSYIENRIRQNLREKHARHIADLRAYYDSEIQSLRQQLESSHRTAASEDLKKINQSLADRYCLSSLSCSLYFKDWVSLFGMSWAVYVPLQFWRCTYDTNTSLLHINFALFNVVAKLWLPHSLVMGLDRALSCLISWRMSLLMAEGLDLDELEGSFQLKLFHISI